MDGALGSAEVKAGAEVAGPRAETLTPASAAGESRLWGPSPCPRAEIDTSAPFESVKEAVDRFGGSALWKSQLKQLFNPEKHHYIDEVEIMKVEEQAAQLEKDLIVKERETLDVLKELEMTKSILGGLRLKLQKEEASEVTKVLEMNSKGTKVHPVLETEEHPPRNLENQVDSVGPCMVMKQSPGLILMELKQAKMNLTRTTSDIAGIRASVEILKNKIEKEKTLLAKTCEHVSSNTTMASSLEEELDQTKKKLQVIKDAENRNSAYPSDIPREIQQLSSEMEVRKMTEASKSEVSRLTAEIEQTKANIKTAEIRWLAVKKMEEAAKAAEAAALAEIKALMNSSYGSSAVDVQTPSVVTLPMEEFAVLTRKAQEADEISRKKIEAVMVQVDEANQSKLELLTKVEEAAAEVKISRKALEEALLRVEAANRGKLAVEEALRRWRSEHGQKRRSIGSSTKFKNSCPGHHRRDSRMLDLNGMALVTDVPRDGSRPTLSIGQILSRKLIGPEEYDIGIREKINGKPKISLGQMLSRRHGVFSPQRTIEDGATRKQFSGKRKKFGFVGLSVLLAKQSKRNNMNKKRRQAWSP